MDQGDLGGVVGEVERFFDRGVAAADDQHFLAAIEKTVAGGAGRDPEPLEGRFRGQAQPLGLGAGGDDDALGVHHGPGVHCHPERAFREVYGGDDVLDDFRAHVLGLGAHLLHQPGALDDVCETGIVLDIGGDHQLAAGLQAGDHHGGKHGPGGVDGGGIAGGSRANDGATDKAGGGSGHGCYVGEILDEAKIGGRFVPRLSFAGAVSMAIGIDDPDDPRIAAYCRIRERDLTGREGRFIAEGEVVLRVLLGSHQCRAVSILVDEKRLDKLKPLLDMAPDVPVYAAGQGVIDAIAGFHLHRGILALGERVARPAVADLLSGLSGKALVVGLMGIGNHDNMGGIFRNAAAFGADAVVLEEDCCDPLYRKAIRVSVGASLTMPFAWADGDMAGDLLAAGFDVLARKEPNDSQTSNRRGGRRCCSGPRGRACRRRCWRAAGRCAYPWPGRWTA